MKWYEFYKAHTLINDLLGHAEDLLRRMRAVEVGQVKHEKTIKDRMEADRQEALTAIANDSESLDDRITKRLEALGDEMQKRMGKLELAAAEMFKDAEEIKRTAERLHRREGEFTSMIDSRCRDIGGKIRENIVGDLQREADRASQAATDCKNLVAYAVNEFSDKLGEHKRTTDRKLGLLGNEAALATSNLVAAAKAEIVAEVDRKISAGPKTRGR